ncbi:urokinase plasminogen activator surface receptor-like [Scomber japonicus]|uniref:urokinase plasminogen activator surface receptor-like n=1 Tax=Scomber japonicus TaxID=13676 RepID=UPI00230592A3|nr:urokinase plasminogen activator surface receptor-like [Scomber japonicus]
MMKLILSLTLIWTLSSTAEALKCWQGLMGMDELRPCASTTEWCVTVASQVTVNGNLHQFTTKSCVPLSPNIEGKHTFSLNLGFLSASVCNTDGCNSEDKPYPNDLKKNNLQCFTCEDSSSAECKKKTVQCVGDEDRCISGTAESMGVKGHTFGCVSGDLCEDLYDLQFLPGGNFTQPPKCCKGSFCNSSWSVKLNVMTLLFGLIALICY